MNGIGSMNAEDNLLQTMTDWPIVGVMVKSHTEKWAANAKGDHFQKAYHLWLQLKCRYLNICLRAVVFTHHWTV